jgi:acyl-CoA hydrolase
MSGFDFRGLVRAGDVVAWPQGPGEPTGLSADLVAQRHGLPPFALLLGLGASDTVRREHADRIALRALNGAGTNRRWTECAEIVPVPVSHLPARLAAGELRVDVVLLRVRRAARAGAYTTGVICDYTAALVGAARVVIAELDDRLPLTGGDALLPEGAVHHVVPRYGPDILMPDPEPSDTDRAIARHVASLIPDGATIQLGVGTLPTAIAAALRGHRALGVHSGVVSDVLVDLVEGGAVTNARKGIDAGVTVTGGLFGTERLRAHADGNPAVAMRAASYTHNPAVLARLHAMHAINSAVEIDLTGQANSELAAGRYLGAVGGQLDFVRGCQVAADGRSILALPSTTPDGRHSRIVAALQGGPVTTPRSDMDIVVTEHGVARLRGCGLQERARRLLAIADPRFHERLAPVARQAAE